MFFIISYDLKSVVRILNLYQLTTILKLSTGVKKLLTLFFSPALKKKERDRKEVASRENKEEQRKIDGSKINERKKRKAGVGRRVREQVTARK